MPDQQDARRHPGREFFCCNDCVYDSRIIARKYTHCLVCGKELPDKRKPNCCVCNTRCAAIKSHMDRSKESYKPRAKRVDTVEVPEWLLQEPI